MSGPTAVRPAEPGDVPLLLSLIRELAEYERAADQVVGTEELLAAALFGPRPSAEAVVAEIEDEAVGFALFHGTFSTWECRAGIWLEDLYVPPQHRRRGVGQALLAHLAGVAVERGCSRLEWAALSWNAPALEFYDKLGATHLEEWQMHRLDGAMLSRIARSG